jgi:hypothetical protein
VSNRAGGARPNPSRAGLALGLLALLILTGCSVAASEPVEPNSSAHARLDPDTGEILMPLSDYDLIDTNRDTETLNHALRIYIRKCMERRGLPYTVAAVSDENRIVDDRPYGIWYEANARVYGFGLEPSAVDTALDKDRSAGGQPWTDAEQECSIRAEGDADLMKFMPTNAELNSSIVPTIRTEAYQRASSDPIWQTAREKWWNCLRDAGLDPLTGASDWGTSQDVPTSVGSDGKAEWSEEAIQIAFTQAQCNNSTGLSQALGDLEASYQAVLIEKNQSALNEWKVDKQSRIAAAAEYISTHG